MSRNTSRAAGLDDALTRTATRRELRTARSVSEVLAIPGRLADIMNAGFRGGAVEVSEGGQPTRIHAANH